MYNLDSDKYLNTNKGEKDIVNYKVKMKYTWAGQNTIKIKSLITFHQIIQLFQDSWMHPTKFSQKN